MGMILGTAKMIVHTLMDMIKIIPHQNDYRSLSEVMLGFIKLTINTNHI